MDTNQSMALTSLVPRLLPSLLSHTVPQYVVQNAEEEPGNEARLLLSIGYNITVPHKNAHSRRISLYPMFGPTLE